MTQKRRKASVVCFVCLVLFGCMIFDRVHRDRRQAWRATEAVLKQDLYNMRTAIDQYTQARGKAPQDLNDLVAAGYLHDIPKDPFTHKADTWQALQEDVLTPVDQTPPGITDVKSGSNLVSSEGNAYSEW